MAGSTTGGVHQVTALPAIFVSLGIFAVLLVEVSAFHLTIDPFLGMTDLHDLLPQDYFEETKRMFRPSRNVLLALLVLLSTRPALRPAFRTLVTGGEGRELA